MILSSKKISKIRKKAVIWQIIKIIWFLENFKSGVQWCPSWNRRSPYRMIHKNQPPLPSWSISIALLYFSRWIERFPSIEILANVSDVVITFVQKLHERQKLLSKSSILAILDLLSILNFRRTREMLVIGDHTTNVICVLCWIDGLQQISKSRESAVKYRIILSL